MTLLMTSINSLSLDEPESAAATEAAAAAAARRTTRGSEKVAEAAAATAGDPCTGKGGLPFPKETHKDNNDDDRLERWLMQQCGVRLSVAEKIVAVAKTNVTTTASEEDLKNECLRLHRTGEAIEEFHSFTVEDAFANNHATSSGEEEGATTASAITTVGETAREPNTNSPVPLLARKKRIQLPALVETTESTDIDDSNHHPETKERMDKLEETTIEDSLSRPSLPSNESMPSLLSYQQASSCESMPSLESYGDLDYIGDFSHRFSCGGGSAERRSSSTISTAGGGAERRSSSTISTAGGGAERRSSSSLQSVLGGWDSIRTFWGQRAQSTSSSTISTAAEEAVKQLKQEQQLSSPVPNNTLDNGFIINPLSGFVQKSLLVNVWFRPPLAPAPASQTTTAGKDDDEVKKNSNNNSKNNDQPQLQCDENTNKNTSSLPSLQVDNPATPPLAANHPITGILKRQALPTVTTVMAQQQQQRQKESPLMDKFQKGVEVVNAYLHGRKNDTLNDDAAKRNARSFVPPSKPVRRSFAPQSQDVVHDIEEVRKAVKQYGYAGSHLNVILDETNDDDEQQKIDSRHLFRPSSRAKLRNTCVPPQKPERRVSKDDDDILEVAKRLKKRGGNRKFPERSSNMQIQQQEQQQKQQQQQKQPRRHGHRRQESAPQPQTITFPSPTSPADKLPPSRSKSSQNPPTRPIRRVSVSREHVDRLVKKCNSGDGDDGLESGSFHDLISATLRVRSSKSPKSEDQLKMPHRRSSLEEEAEHLLGQYQRHTPNSDPTNISNNKTGGDTMLNMPIRRISKDADGSSQSVIDCNNNNNNNHLNSENNNKGSCGIDNQLKMPIRRVSLSESEHSSSSSLIAASAKSSMKAAAAAAAASMILEEDDDTNYEDN